MKTKSILYISILLFTLCACTNNNEEEITQEWAYFPVTLDIPAQGGTFHLYKNNDDDFSLSYCYVSLVLTYSDKEGDVDIIRDSVETHKYPAVINNKTYYFTDCYYNSWLEIKKQNTHEISVTVDHNRTGRTRKIRLITMKYLDPHGPSTTTITQVSE